MPDTTTEKQMWEKQTQEKQQQEQAAKDKEAQAKQAEAKQGQPIAAPAEPPTDNVESFLMKAHVFDKEKELTGERYDVLMHCKICNWEGRSDKAHVDEMKKHHILSRRRYWGF